jgi:hypothetical protein
MSANTVYDEVITITDRCHLSAAHNGLATPGEVDGQTHTFQPRNIRLIEVQSPEVTELLNRLSRNHYKKALRAAFLKRVFATNQGASAKFMLRVCSYQCLFYFFHHTIRRYRGFLSNIVAIRLG